MLICSLLFQFRVTVAIMMVRKGLFVCVCMCVRVCACVLYLTCVMMRLVGGMKKSLTRWKVVRMAL